MAANSEFGLASCQFFGGSKKTGVNQDGATFHFHSKPRDPDRSTSGNPIGKTDPVFGKNDG